MGTGRGRRGRLNLRAWHYRSALSIVVSKKNQDHRPDTYTTPPWVASCASLSLPRPSSLPSCPPSPPPSLHALVFSSGQATFIRLVSRRPSPRWLDVVFSIGWGRVDRICRMGHAGLSQRGGRRSQVPTTTEGFSCASPCSPAPNPFHPGRGVLRIHRSESAYCNDRQMTEGGSGAEGPEEACSARILRSC